MRRQFKRYDPAKLYTLKGSLLNEILDSAEWASRFTVAPPLMLDEGPSGRVLRIRLNPGDPWFRLAGTLTKYGLYSANPILAADTPIDTTVASAFSLTDYGTPDTTRTVYLLNVLEANNDGAVTHYLTVGGGYTPQDFQGTFWFFAKDGTPIYLFEGDNDNLCA